MPIGQLRVVDAEAVEDRRLQVVDVDGVFGDVVAEFVGFADDGSRFGAAAGQPHGEREGVVVAAFAAGNVAAANFIHGGAAELAAPDYERFLEQAAAL